MVTRKRIREGLDKSWASVTREQIVERVMEMIKGRNANDIEIELEITPNVIIHS